MAARASSQRITRRSIVAGCCLPIVAFLAWGCGDGEPAPSDDGAASTPTRLTFVDVTAKTGIDFRCVCGGAEKDYIVEVNGAGCALFDYDNDGLLDIFLVNGGRLPGDPNATGAPPSDRLYRNLGDLKFKDVTEEVGLIESAWGCGCCVADYDNDGDLDLYVTNLGADELWENQNGESFKAVGGISGANDPGWGASCAFVDYDLDGLVDLFVVDYLEFDRDKVKPRGPDSCDYVDQKILCGPKGLPRVSSVLYRNLGDGKFEDVSETAGIRVKDGYGLGVAIGDYDNDGWPDIYVASDSTENLMFHNLGNGKFEEVGLELGVARNDSAVAQAGMGVQFAYVRNAKLEDLFVVNYEDDTNTYYRNDDGFFTETTSATRLGSPCFKYLGWGCFFADFDLDTDLDLFVAQGHVVPQADNVASSLGYKQPNKLFLNDGSGKFVDYTAEAGSGLAVSKSSRGAAYGDLDGDGDLDIVINEIDDAATILECVGKPRGHWLGVRTVGTISNRAGIGTRVVLTADGKAQAQRVQSSVGYASHCELTLRFGLGESTKVQELRVEWPSRKVEVFPVDVIDRILTVEEGKGRAP
jgi:hypothetical protein